MIHEKLFEQASILLQQCRYAEAESICRGILKRCPNHPRALNALGLVLFQNGGSPDDSIALIRRAIDKKYDYLDAWCNLGRILLKLGRLSETENCYKEAVKIFPAEPAVWHGLGNLHFQKHQMEDALKCYDKSLEIKLSVASCLQRGAVLRGMIRFEESALSYKQALELNPDCWEAYYGLSVAFEAGANYSEARKNAQQALNICPDASGPLQILAQTFLVSGKADEAILLYMRAFESGGGTQAFSNFLYAMNFSHTISQKEIFIESCKWKAVSSSYNNSYKFPKRNPGRLRIGYISPDFRNHSVAYFFEPLLAAHSRDAFEIHCYSNVAISDSTTHRIREMADSWHDIRRLTDEEAVLLIRADHIDILVDLTGHTADNRLGIFAKRAAPVQITWLGYPNTTGLSTIDYRFTDDIADPLGICDSMHTERLMRLPGGFLCYAPPKDAPEAVSPPVLKNGYVTFGSFNNPAKITPEVIEIWSNILLAVPGSRLLLKSKPFCEPSLANEFSSMFAEYGISADRVVCHPAIETVSGHLEQYQLIDIALDTFPYNGTTTTFEALYMGVPVIALKGERHSARVGVSILTILGKPELIADTPADYIKIAVKLCSDIELIRGYHESLRSWLEASALMDSANFAASIEDAYRDAWRKHTHAHPDSRLEVEEIIVKAKDYLLQGDITQSEALYREILLQQPENPRALNGFGGVSYRKFDSESAIAHISHALDVKPDYIAALSLLGKVYKDAGFISEAINCFHNALNIDPGYQELHSNILMNMQYQPQVKREELFEEAKRWSLYHARRPISDQNSTKTVGKHTGKIRIGFVSGDFKKHPVGNMLIPFLFFFSRDKFEVFCYSNTEQNDEVTGLIKSMADVWRSVLGQSDRAAYKIIHDDSIDILVDLSGHTADNRLPMFSMRPAPIQVSWLGYFDTTGLNSIDYFISDHHITLPEDERWFTEKLAYMPNSRFCYAPPQYAPPVSPPPSLKNGVITFGSFNNTTKINNDVITIWSSILTQVHNSRLVIKWKRCFDNLLVSRITKQFEMHGINTEQLEFRGESGHLEMLCEYGDIDIALDPFPFSGGMTSLEALWMGVPIVTLYGERAVGRQTASFLHILKHSELVAGSVEEYCNIAVGLAREPKRLASLRNSLRDKMNNSSLCNAPKFAADISRLFEQMLLDYSSIATKQNPHTSEIDKADLEEYCNRAAQLVSRGELDKAENLYKLVLTSYPKYLRALHALGVVLYRKGKHEEGISLLRETTNKYPEFIDAFFNLGRMLNEQGRFIDAAECYSNVLKLRADDSNAWLLLSINLTMAGQRERAINALKELIAIDPGNSDALSRLSQLLLDSGKVDEAEECLEQIEKFTPENSGLDISKGNIAMRRNAYAEAERYYISALNSPNSSAYAHANLGYLFTQTKHFKDAIEHCMLATSLRPDLAVGHANLAYALTLSGQLHKAYDAYKMAIEAAPLNPSTHSSLLMLMHYLPESTQEDILKMSSQWDAIHTQKSLYKNNRQTFDATGRRLRIGFVSPDFRRHPVGYFISSFLKFRDPEHVELFCYSCSTVDDDITRILRESSDNWTNISCFDNLQAVDTIKNDEIDILVDLAGHSAGNRLPLFGMKPAPVQVTWAGYAGTTGVSAIDYLISDRFQSPIDSENYCSEQIIRMPHDYICYSPPPFAPEVSTLPSLSNGFVTFGVLNNLAKISSDTIAVWAAILKNVPGSVIFVKNPSFDDEWVVERYLELFESCGIARSRVMTEGQSPPEEMLVRYNNIDIQLDTFPYSGGLTTLESLWMGVPVITIPGDLFSSRHSLTHLKNVGLDELIALTKEEYIDIACRLAMDIDELSRLRTSLRFRLLNSPVCDGKLFADNLQQAFFWIWQRHCIPSFDEPLVFHELPSTEKKMGRENSFTMDDEFLKGLNYIYAKDFISAAEVFESIVLREPDNADVRNNLGISYFEIGFYDAAKDEFKLATKLAPAHADAWKNLGKAIRDTGGNPETAARCLRKAIAIDKTLDDAWMILGATLLDRGRSSEAVSCFRKALELNPSHCDARSNFLFALNYLPQITQVEIFHESLKWDEMHTGDIVRCSHVNAGKSINNNKIRIGYVSGDFKRHPVGYHFLPVIEAHDRERFVIYCYSTLRDKDELTELIQSLSTEWRDISNLSDDEAASLVVMDRIDILVDLSGHTKGGRLRLFARKPAPVQVSWLGYFNTTGVNAIDYLISDDTTIPYGEEQSVSEQVVRLPGCRFCYRPPEYSPCVSTPPVLTNGFVTFGSFNNIAKLTPEVIRLWSMVLNSVAGSRLILKWPALEKKKVRDRLLRQFEKNGISAQRLEFRGNSPHAKMLEEYSDVDIALDPFPFTGGLTSCEALWMGVPVITLLSDKPAGRQTSAFLRTISLDDLVSKSHEQYISCAVEYSTDITRLQRLRFELRGKMCSSTLCDGQRFTRGLEASYLNMLKNNLPDENIVCEPLVNDILPEFSDNYVAAAMAYNTGIDLMESGRTYEALDFFEQAVGLNPGFASAYNNQGILLAQIERYREAESAFKNAIAADPSFSEAYCNLGILLGKTGSIYEALHSLDRALLFSPEYGTAYLEKGNLLLKLDDYDMSLSCYENALTYSPDSAAIYSNIGAVNLRLENMDEAEQNLSTALILDPEYLPAYINLSILFRDMGLTSKAEQVAKKGLEYFPGNTDLMSLIAWSNIAQCRIAEAVRCLKDATNISPYNANLHSNLLFALQYDSDINLSALHEEHRIWFERHLPLDANSRAFKNCRDYERKLVIGYVSPDFGRHPVGYFLHPVLAAHDKKYFKIICYSDNKKADDLTLLLESHTEVWRDTSNSSDDDLLKLVERDKIDILVDLAGHTPSNRLKLFARRGAPIQVTWAGYVGTTGLSTMDYLISDRYESPDYADSVTTEKIIRLPDGYICYSPPDYAPDVCKLPALANDYVMFGCFNNLSKINENVADLWSELLRYISNSRLLLKTRSLNDPETCKRYLKLFTDKGIEGDRIILEGDSRHAQLLQSYNRIDIALDPFPYSGGLTTLEALWMGVPVITLGGSRFCSRHSLSHLSVLGLEELIADDAQSYIHIASGLANDLSSLSALRSSLRERMAVSPLCDGEMFTKNLESAYRQMWFAWLKKSA